MYDYLTDKVYIIEAYLKSATTKEYNHERIEKIIKKLESEDDFSFVT